MIFKVLLVEDEAELSAALKQFLSNENYKVISATNCKDGLAEIKKNDFDICLFDINLPDGSGNQLVEQFRKKNEEAGIVVLSANNLVKDKIKSLDIGADDYLVKPFDLQELNARMRTVLRRKQKQVNDGINFNEINLKVSDFDAFVNQNKVQLTKKEFELLMYFITNKDKLITKETIVSHLWKDLVVHSNYDFIYAHVKNLRKKLFLAGARDYIKNIHSIGYKFTDS